MSMIVKEMVEEAMVVWMKEFKQEAID